MKMRFHLLILAAIGAPALLHAQGPGVPIIREGHGASPEFVAATNKLREAGGLLNIDKVKEQLARSSCELTLLPENERKLSGERHAAHAAAAANRRASRRRCLVLQRSARAFGLFQQNVSTEWAPGSSGAAVIDECGNAIGHVSEISAHGEKTGQSGGTKAAGGTLIVFRNAVRAADVQALVKDPAK